MKINWKKMSREDKMFNRIPMARYETESECFIGNPDIVENEEYIIEDLPENLPYSSIEDYQNNKIYLDEFTGQKELRNKYFKNNFLRNKIVNRLSGVPYDVELPIPSLISEILYTYCYFESDQIFNNRWMVKK